MLWIVMPRGLVPPPLSVAAWRKVFTTRAVLLVLGVTILSYIGQFILWPFVAVDLRRNFAVGPAELALLLAVFGTCGVFGTITLTRVINRIGPQVSASIFALLVAIGIFIWFAGHDWFAALVVALLIWGFSYPPVVASQQARLIGNAPELASASIALNASVLYVGQAIGTSAGSAILSHYPITMLALAGACAAGASFLLSFYCHRRWRI
jgi:predicted MFS family arabinose efflux permease